MTLAIASFVCTACAGAKEARTRMATAKDQMSFSGIAPCKQFKAHPFAKTGPIARRCIEEGCGCDIQEHCADAVTEIDVKKVLASIASKPSLIRGSLKNGLYQGGWQAAGREDFLRDANVGLVINTAKGLAAMFPTFASPAKHKLYEELGIETLQLEWVDSAATDFSYPEIAPALEAIDAMLSKGKSVLVHCAQGASRSGVLVVAYVSRKEGKGIEEALTSVQNERPMCQPNGHFMNLLRAMDMK